MSKFISTSNLNKLSKALNDRIKLLVGEEKERAMEAEAGLQAAINGKAPASHTHDDRYFTETEVTNKLAGKSDVGHVHDDLYYTETEIDGKISTLNNAINGKAPASHNHDDRYFTETEINGKIEDINESISSSVSTLEGKIATAKSGAISESKSYTDTAISKLVDSAPEAMNTLNELAKAIGDHQTEYEAYVATVSANITTAKAEAIAEAAKKDTALHTTISAEIDADVKVEKVRAMEAENALQNVINGKANASHGNHVPATQTADNTKFLRNDNTWATVTPGNIGAAPASHTHDDRYYTETEINGKIEDINEAINGHVADLEAAINGKAPASHNHDDRYYTESEMNTKLAGKSDTGHTHDDRYYTESEIDGKITTINNAINGKAPSTHTHDDRYYTETEINGKIEDINETINNKEAALQSSITNLTNNKADISYVNGKLEVVDAIKLNGYSLWVGTTAELEAITERDPNTLYFEIGDETGEEVVQVDIVNGVLQLTADKYQKTNMLDGTEIVFPAVNKFTEIHLYFAAGSNMNINLPDNCKWRVEPNIEEGNSYEIVATYNTIEWLVNVIVYS